MQKLKNRDWLQRVVKRILLLSSILAFSSCLDYQAANIYIYLDQSDFYQGTAKIEFVNIHSNESDFKERRLEMSEFYKGYKKEGRSILEVIPLYDATVKLTNKSALSTDAYIEGEFNNLLTILAPLFQEGTFRFEGNAKRISVWWKNPLKEDDNVNLILIYSGKIVSHNSKHFDSKANSLTWSMSKNGDSEIKFVLEAE
ncbi:MAG: hypothetical protein ABUK01_05225 [Leptospirales bacterium]